MDDELRPQPGDVTHLLSALRHGEREALDRLLPIVYDELRIMARRQLGRERAGHTLHATALVHEAYFKLARGGPLDVADRAHFLAIASRAMRQVLVEHARRRNAEKRGGGWEVTTLSTGEGAVEFSPDELLALDRALADLDDRQRQVVEYRFFGGMEEQEIATVLGVSERTVRRDWVKARAWLYRSLYPQADGEEPRPA
ncbi:MAG: sigma-70 family RNA polymerase sigma factor [Gemmatimonadetes bacterium]|uniref:Sigma-70 family RNA polymerase sigma factor n=1 Tax=Candidatus Kutchimonas denitrificans TaxID=3056748 RepID=A0AAE4Z5N8_9BACT|nr:sigma-70 family RNA polymerase sigma factor [Gemmatimonadota bacterium]NIR73804.1 sigma-70 family RNA polymerase sigma factor [Candidatus Kutchimonas denitrificans]NIS00077.1 sigma-70 family RNA polymerase sigma factor [Gemmatimonadota bacterium]NIT65666.1 sigma-70 family RNA polymerase sigma factor [Gemmatimonadota bacterium]NIU53114.1 sigma-70 family RNA polymerase sigma factor [Gemmatimonadota bacterium]